jgi:hypothetical protein
MKKCSQESEITMCYGFRSNEQMLIYSGFVAQKENEFDEVRLAFTLNESDDLIKFKKLTFVKFFENHKNHEIVKNISAMLSPNCELLFSIKSSCDLFPSIVIFFSLVNAANKEEMSLLLRQQGEFADIINTKDHVDTLTTYLKESFSHQLLSRSFIWLFHEFSKHLSIYEKFSEFKDSHKSKASFFIKLLNEVFFKKKYIYTYIYHIIFFQF